MFKRIFTMALAVVATVALTASPASAGGSGDFYHHWTCKPNYYGYSGITANLDVTNYDNGSGQTYHMDMDAGGFTVKGLYFDNTRLSAWNDTYKTVSDRNAHTITAIWFYGPYLLATTTKCSVSG